MDTGSKHQDIRKTIPSTSQQAMNINAYLNTSLLISARQGEPRRGSSWTQNPVNLDIKLSDPMQNGSGNKTLQARQMSITTAHKFHTCEI
jgi:hypothetical protein